MTYPQVQDERATIEAARAGASLSRFGDGEFRLAVGGSAISQAADPALRQDLCHLLKYPKECGAHVCIPRIGGTTLHHWRRYTLDEYTRLLDPTFVYGSAFISRPDSAPGIDRPEYWDAVRELWRGRRVVLVSGDDKSLRRAELLETCAQVQRIAGPERDAYSHRYALLSAIPTDADLVLLCLGATATVLAEFLARRGQQALDLGHLGMFMRTAGAFGFGPEELISSQYRQQNVQLHADPRGFGADGRKHAAAVMSLARELRVRSILDYGCGEGTLKPELKRLGFSRSIQEYDPAMRGRDHLPKPAELVVCTDVLEHVEPEKLDAVLRHLRKLTMVAGYFVIATRLAKKVLPDGRNAHLIHKPPAWWRLMLESHGFQITAEAERSKDGQVRDVTYTVAPC